MKQILECIPNFSEGRNKSVIDKIADSIRQFSNVKILHIDIGYSANRTVITFAGEPNQVIEAAFEAVKTASELIDMSMHKGIHPRIGATDVLPIVPVSGITMDETVNLSRKLAKKIGEQLRIPVYCYEKSAIIPERKKLEFIRKGEYEGIAVKILNPSWKPDYGPNSFNIKSGATILGARDFLIAYNINLNSDSKELANEIAAEIRESGKIIYSENGIKNRIPGLFKSVKAIGWYIEEYKKAQVSLNLTDINIVPLHVAFEAVKEIALKRGIEVTGSEVIGLVPLKVLLEAGRFYTLSSKSNHSEKELINIAIEKLGLSEIKPFIPEDRIIDFLI
jgi:glutamate formiminotransferase/formiminotetrahydrofolate cyclodeaminase